MAGSSPEDRESRQKNVAEEHPPELNRPEVKHEESDVNVWAVGRFAIALILVCIAALLLLAGLLKYFLSQEPQATLPQPFAGLNVDARRLPPEPRLQSAPILDLEEMRAAEDKIQNSYGWIDQQKGITRIPIDRAIDLLAQRGLPARTSVEQSAGTADVPTESGMGPIMQQPGGPLAGELSHSQNAGK